MKRNKIYIAITGQIASGKSSFSNLLKQRDENFLVLDADDQIKELYKSCLLYTSPSPRDRQKSRMPSSA